MSGNGNENLLMESRDIPPFVMAHMDQVQALLKQDDETKDHLHAFVEPYLDLRRHLISENGIEPAIADAAIQTLVATFTACVQLDSSEP
jgi:hypothetical protein